MSLSICRLQRPVQTNRISTLTSLSFVLSFFSGALGALLFIYSLPRRLNWKLKQQSVRNSILRLGVGFWIFQYKYERESDQWDRKSVFQIDIDSVYSSSTEFWMKQFFNHLSNQKSMVDFIKSGWQKNWTGIGICERDSGKRILWKLIWVAWRDLDLKYW